MCLQPVVLKRLNDRRRIFENSHFTQVPCGNCLECRRTRQHSWHVRLNTELKNATSAHFLTLTYDDDTLPHTDTWRPTLDYKDFPRIMKRFRKNHKTKKPVKYFTVGEYGTETNRPHYHSIIFNLENPENFAKEWTYGHTHVGEVNDATIYYTLKYCLKTSLILKDPDDDRQPEKALISKKIGIDFLTPQMIQYFKDDVTRPVTMLGNQKIPLPRYYRDKIFTDYEKFSRTTQLLPLQDEATQKKLEPLYFQRIEEKYRKAKEAMLKTN